VIVIRLPRPGRHQERGNRRHSRREPVEPVQKIERVHHADQPEERQAEANQSREPVGGGGERAGNADDVNVPDPGDDCDRGGSHLARQVRERRQCQHLVEHANRDRRQPAGQHAEHRPLQGQDGKAREREGQVDGDSAHERCRARVDLVADWAVDQPQTHGRPAGERREHGRADEAEGHGIQRANGRSWRDVEQ
jgi:hypothetical protein